MKRILLTSLMTIMSFGFAWSQCVATCSNYAVTPITFTTFPVGSTNVVPSFTNPYIGTWADDGSVSQIPIGFNFDFFCTTYSTVSICSNGFIMFDYMAFPWPTQYVQPTQTLPDPTLPNGMVAFNMTDLDPTTTGSITYTTVGTSPYRQFIVTYSNVPCFSSSSDLNTGQIVLYETTNIIEIHTTKARPDANQGTAGSTQGIENTAGTIGFTPPGRNANSSWGSSADNTAYKFSPFTPAPPTSITGPTVLCQGDNTMYTASYMIGATSYSWSLPAQWTGSSANTTIAATAGATGVLSVTATYTCGMSAPMTIAVQVLPAPVVGINSVTPAVVCSGANVSITVNGASTYTINPGNITGTSPLVDMPMATTVYSLYGTGANGCNSINTPTASILVNETPTVTVNSGTVCEGTTFTIIANGANSYTYSSLFSQVTPAPGSYTYLVTGTGTNGCVSMPAYSTLTVSPLPGVSLIANRQTICIKESVTLTAGGATTYSWSGSTSTNSQVVLSPTVTANHSVTGVGPTGCAKTASVLVSVNPCVGIDEQSATGSWMVFPNPSSGLLHVVIPSHGEAYLYDLTGRCVQRAQVKEADSVIDLTSLPTGRYVIRIVSGGETLHRVIVRE